MKPRFELEVPSDLDIPLPSTISLPEIASRLNALPSQFSITSLPSILADLPSIESLKPKLEAQAAKAAIKHKMTPAMTGGIVAAIVVVILLVGLFWYLRYRKLKNLGQRAVQEIKIMGNKG
ncbi:hypothetical protein EJ04DRAFT_570275 [Polyplosphaeria fusca]|uniref:Uncharacterized protein n=1 Tax=Polyplosphaeria fusca TaxID=682080 RepID=A0A9P4QMH7_9PLEO|nr:hypothetical protein EJ04DRAFT_570275 [Polyplosphaeria fusca]